VTDEDPVSGRRSDDTSMPVVLHRLDAIEHRLEQNAKDTHRGFSDVRQQINGLTFVRLDVYDADQRTATQIHAELAREIGSTVTQVRLLWSVVGATVIAGLIGILFEIASRS
jgi:hypothetical protein